MPQIIFSQKAFFANLDPLFLRAVRCAVPVLDKRLRLDLQPAKGPVSVAPRRALVAGHGKTMYDASHVPTPLLKVDPQGHRQRLVLFQVHHRDLGDLEPVHRLPRHVTQPAPAGGREEQHAVCRDVTGAGEDNGKALQIGGPLPDEGGDVGSLGAAYARRLERDAAHLPGESRVFWSAEKVERGNDLVQAHVERVDGGDEVSERHREARNWGVPQTERAEGDLSCRPADVDSGRPGCVNDEGDRGCVVCRGVVVDFEGPGDADLGLGGVLGGGKSPDGQLELDGEVAEEGKECHGGEMEGVIWTGRFL